jgi:hypothetical protein
MTKHLMCNHCFHIFKIRPWHLLKKANILMPQYYTTCPSCGKKGWNMVPPFDWIPCYQCVYKKDCETRDMREGCYMGELKKWKN